MIPPRQLRRYTGLNVLLDMLFFNRISLASYAPWVDANDRRGLALYQETLSFGFVGAVCLSSAKETFHHWHVFAPGPAGVCVHFDVDVFLSMFAGDPHYMAGPMRYQQLEHMRSVDASDIHLLPFFKRAGFTAEEEFRVIGTSVPPVDIMHVPLAEGAIRKITLSPLLHPGLVQSTRAAIRAVPGWEDLTVIHSKLIDSATWERRLNSFVSRHGVVYGPWYTGAIDVPDG